MSFLPPSSLGASNGGVNVPLSTTGTGVTEDAAALKIQTFVRKHIDFELPLKAKLVGNHMFAMMVSEAVETIKTHRAASKIQGFVTGMQARQKIRRQQAAASQIQPIARQFIQARRSARHGKTRAILLRGTRQKQQLLKRFQKLEQRIEESYQKGILDHSAYIREADLLVGALKRFHALGHKVDLGLRSDWNTMDVNELQVMIDGLICATHTELAVIAENVGFSSINQGLKAIIGPSWKEELPSSILASVEFYHQHFVPTGYRMSVISEEDEGHYSLEHPDGTFFQVEREEIDAACVYLSPRRIFPPFGDYEEIHGAEVCVPLTINSQFTLLVFKGYFKEDPIDVRGEYGLITDTKRRLNILLASSPLPKEFRQTFLDQYPTKDLLLNSPEEIELEMIHNFRELDRLKTISMTMLCQHFAAVIPSAQARILSLLVSDKSTRRGYFLYDLSGKVSPTFREYLRRMLPYSVKKALDITEESVKELRERLEGISKKGVSLSTRILTSRMDESAKALLMEKEEELSSGSSDYHKLKAWLERALKIPFGKYVPELVSADATREEISAHLCAVKERLDAAVYGHEDAKRTLMRVVGQWVSNGSSGGEVLAIQGPPGNGKTTFAKEGVAKALNRPFVYMPLGGMTDASYLVGHGYTYVGATCGRIVEMLMEADCMNPIIYFDELDKISQTPKGKEIIGVLTHLIDASQNSEFQDKYFAGLPFDLSKALFIFSYNDESLIDPILKDRMITIRTEALPKKNKLVIARDYLMPNVLKTVGFEEGEVLIKPEMINFIIENYTNEAGVRRLKEQLFAIVREINLDRLMDASIELPILIDEAMVVKCLKAPYTDLETILPEPTVGSSNGLYAVPAAGRGGVLKIQTFQTLSRDPLQLKVTGNQGDVMKESVQVAHTVAWNLLPTAKQEAIRLGEPFGMHIHIPEGATPKDGPSAGGALTVSMVSRLTGIPIRNDVAMTGEIDLSGRITKIGGLRYKIEGAKKAGVKLVLCPRENTEDLEKIKGEFPEIFEDGFEVRTVDHITELLHYTLLSDLETEGL